MRVLLIEDDPVQATSIELSLASEGIITDKAHLGKDGIEYSKLYNYDLIILDLKLPDIHGHDVLLRLRSQKIKTPIIILSGLLDINDKIKGLGCGADDYVTKPYNCSELAARVKAIIRRSKGHSESSIKVGDLLIIDLETRTVCITNKAKIGSASGQGKKRVTSSGDVHVHLTNKEYKIIELLAMRKGTVLTKEMFLNHLYNGIDEPEVKIIDVFICKLRRKLEEASGGINFIETVWGRGYMLKEFDQKEGSNYSNLSYLEDNEVRKLD